ncbi:hypothetical protein B0H10DRAFT_2242195 [Mycena sp. CBHHK59/15]|nr:hypothetical protein B0H10DRAFT_2242195 [Mycena sp. CBHHK59/15]
MRGLSVLATFTNAVANATASVRGLAPTSPPASSDPHAPPPAPDAPVPTTKTAQYIQSRPMANPPKGHPLAPAVKKAAAVKALRHNPDGPTNLVITGSCPKHNAIAKNPDGTDVQLPKVNMQAMQIAKRNAPSEQALLARGTKRKAAEPVALVPTKKKARK